MMAIIHHSPRKSSGARKESQPKRWARATASSGMYALSPAGIASPNAVMMSIDIPSPPAFPAAAVTNQTDTNQEDVLRGGITDTHLTLRIMARVMAIEA